MSASADGSRYNAARRDVRSLRRVASRLDDGAVHASTPIDWLKSTTRPARRQMNAIVRELRKHGTACAAGGGPGLLRQAVDLSWLCTTHGVPAYNYYRYRLYEPGLRPRAPGFLDFRVLRVVEDAIIRAARADRSALSDKRLFAQTCAKHRFGTVPILAWYENGDGPDEVSLPSVHLFSKPVDGANGRGAAIWRHHAHRRWSDGELDLDEPGLLAEIARRSQDGAHLLQPLVVNHPALRPLSGGGASCVRVVTIRFPNQPAEHLWSAFKMTPEGGAADNFVRGGLLAPVDAETGTLGPAFRKASGHVPLRRHPDTGAAIEGVRLPGWRDVVHACQRFHDEAFPVFPGIGWDVAITGDGPVFIEGNPNWCSTLMQRAHGRPLGETRVPACYLAHVSALRLV